MSHSNDAVARDNVNSRHWLRSPAALWVLACMVGLLYVLPHGVRMISLHTVQAYSPFSAHVPSPMVWDETFLYGAEAKYSLTRGGRPAYDDTWEHRASIYPYSILPMEMEAALARLLGSLDAAQIAITFLFPALAAWLLMRLLWNAGAGTWWAAVGALAVLVLAFSPRSLLLADRAFLLHGHGLRVFETLEAARTPNPSMTFPLLLGAVLCLSRALNTERGRMRWAAAAGTLGGLLFFSYIYYAIAWSAAMVLLTAVMMLLRDGAGRQDTRRAAAISLGCTVLLAIPFLWWKHAANPAEYLARSSRLGLSLTHALNAQGEILTLEWGAATLLLLAWWWRTLGAEESPTQRYGNLLGGVLLALLAGALAGINMQLVTGFNMQASHHFPHMVLQPVAALLLAVLLSRSRLKLAAARQWMAPATFFMLYAAAAVAQVEAGRDSAEFFRVPPSERLLFSWLNAHTPVGSVVATDDLAINVVLPVRTHNFVLVSEGSRGTATDDELVERFLLASRLAGRSSPEVYGELNNSESANTAVPPATQSSYLFESSAWMRVGSRRIRPERLPALMQSYPGLDVAADLQRFRVDYLWATADETPYAPSGFAWTVVFSDDAGRLFALERK